MINRTGYDVTNCFRSEATARKQSKMTLQTALGRILGRGVLPPHQLVDFLLNVVLKPNCIVGRSDIERMKEMKESFIVNTEHECTAINTMQKENKKPTIRWD